LIEYIKLLKRGTIGGLKFNQSAATAPAFTLKVYFALVFLIQVCAHYLRFI